MSLDIVAPCDCYSTNGYHGTVPNVVLTPPERFQATRTVCVDACIAPIIEALWAADVWTYGCCCGHGKPGRSVIVDAFNREAAAKVVRAMGDDAEILAYELVAGDALRPGIAWTVGNTAGTEPLKSARQELRP